LLKDQWIIEEIKEEIKMFMECNENEKCNLSEPIEIARQS
jgi:hypothetical protein